MMKRLIYIPIILPILLAGAASCQRADMLLPDGEVERSDNLPIRLEVSIADRTGDAPDTRSADNAKKEFFAGDEETGEPADIIHVQSTFDCETYTETRYCALRYAGDGVWVPEGSQNFAWPNDAVSGRFTAYYIHGSNAELTDNVGEEETAMKRRFTDIVDGEDPLRAVTPAGEPVRYGHTVRLNFEHILANLTLIELDAGIDEDLVFRIEPGSVDVVGKKNMPLKDGFEVSLADGGNGKEIKFEYIKFDGEEGMAMVKAPTELVRDPQTREESRQVSFFLEPDRTYDAFTIFYSNGNGDRYLSYKNSNPNLSRTLYGNNRYIFDVKKSAGVTIESRREQQWDESDEFTTVVDAGKFLQAVHSNSSYSEIDPKTGEEVLILEATTNPAGTLLQRNIIFQNPYYHVFTFDKDNDGNPITPYDFVPSVGSDNVFDGGFHYVKNLCCPMFYENSGVIKNLGFTDANIGGADPNGMWTSILNYNDGKVTNPPYAYNRTGLIATDNHGTVQNVRVKDATVTVGIHAADDQEAHYVGVLFGINNSSGYVEQVYLSGDIKVVVKNSSTTIPEVNIGGLAGQNRGTLTDIGQLVDNRPDLKEDHRPRPVKISVTNALTDVHGGYRVGGLVGDNTGRLSEVSIPTVTDAVTVDCSGSFGVIAYVGGLVGQAASSQGNEISSCLIGSGSVTAGKTEKYQQLDARSYTGGMVGLFNERTAIFNCTSFCSVKGFSYTGSLVEVACGGVFGTIDIYNGGTAGKMHSIAAFGDALEGTNAGCFAGEAPYNKTWDDYKGVVDVKQIGTLPPIGRKGAEPPQI